MAKKRYIVPIVEIALCNTQELMKVSSESGTPDDPGASMAPRKTSVF